MKALFKLLLFSVLPALAFGGATSSPPAWTYPGAANVTGPITVFVKALPLVSSGAPVDIGTITVPASFGNWGYATATQDFYFGYMIFNGPNPPSNASEPQIQFWTGAGGTGTEIADNGAVGILAGALCDIAPTIQVTFPAGTVIHIRQLVAAGAGTNTLSVYMQLWPAN